MARGLLALCLMLHHVRPIQPAVQTLSTALVVGLTLLCPAAAAACASAVCGGIQLAPSASPVPANLPGFLIQKGSYQGAQLSVVRSDGGETIAILAGDRLGSKLTPGATYHVQVTLSATELCSQRELVTTITAGPEAQLPSTLGVPIVKAQGRGTTAVGFTGGSCYSNLDTGFVDLEPSLEGAAGPWASSLVDVHAVVDGQRYWISAEMQPQEQYYPTRGSGLKELGGGQVRVRVFVACQPLRGGEASSYQPLALGAHRVKLRGTLPGGTVIDTSETEISLSCADGADAGRAEANDGGVGGGAAPGLPPPSESAGVYAAGGEASAAATPLPERDTLANEADEAARDKDGPSAHARGHACTLAYARKGGPDWSLATLCLVALGASLMRERGSRIRRQAAISPSSRARPRC